MAPDLKPATPVPTPSAALTGLPVTRHWVLSQQRISWPLIEAAGPP